MCSGEEEREVKDMLLAFILYYWALDVGSKILVEV